MLSKYSVFRANTKYLQVEILQILRVLKAVFAVFPTLEILEQILRLVRDSVRASGTYGSYHGFQNRLYAALKITSAILYDAWPCCTSFFALSAGTLPAH